MQECKIIIKSLKCTIVDIVLNNWMAEDILHLFKLIEPIKIAYWFIQVFFFSKTIHKLLNIKHE